MEEDKAGNRAKTHRATNQSRKACENGVCPEISKDHHRHKTIKVIPYFELSYSSNGNLENHLGIVVGREFKRPLLAEERECSKQGLIVYMKYTFTLHPYRINR